MKKLGILLPLVLAGCESGSTTNDPSKAFTVTFPSPIGQSQFSYTDKDHCVDAAYIGIHDSEGRLIDSWKVQNNQASITRSDQAHYFSVAYRDVYDNKRYQHSYDMNLVDSNITFNVPLSNSCDTVDQNGARPYTILVNTNQNITKLQPYASLEDSPNFEIDTLLFSDEELPVIAIDSDTQRYGLKTTTGDNVEIDISKPLKRIEIDVHGSDDPANLGANVIWLPTNLVPFFEPTYTYEYWPAEEAMTVYVPDEKGKISVTVDESTLVHHVPDEVRVHENKFKAISYDASQLPSTVSIDLSRDPSSTLSTSRYLGYMAPQNHPASGEHMVIVHSEVYAGQSADELAKMELNQQVFEGFEDGKLCTDLQYEIAGQLNKSQSLGLASNGMVVPTLSQSPTRQEINQARHDLMLLEFEMYETEYEYHHALVNCH